MRVVCDTNILVSAVLFPKSKPDQILEMVRTGQLENFVSQPILDETNRVLREKFRVEDSKREAMFSLVIEISTIVEPGEFV